MARVSLALPVRNGERFLQNCIESVLRQTFEDYEFVIADNASTDRTPEICLSFALADKRVKYHRFEENIGAGPNFNRAFALSSGEYFKWIAHDDLICPGFVAACVAALDARPDAALAFGQTKCIDQAGNAVAWPRHGFMPALDDPDPVARFRLAITHAGTCFPIFGLFRAEVLRATMLHRHYYSSDRALLAEVALLGKVILVPQAIFYNREHPARSIRIADKAERSRWQSTSTRRANLMEHVNLLKQLVEVCVRNRSAAHPARTLAVVARTRLTPRYLGRYALDFVRFVSPAAADRLRQHLTPRRREPDRAGPAPRPEGGST